MPLNHPRTLRIPAGRRLRTVALVAVVASGTLAALTGIATAAPPTGPSSTTAASLNKTDPTKTKKPHKTKPPATTPPTTPAVTTPPVPPAAADDSDLAGLGDSRTVTEPKIPTVCATVPAGLALTDRLGTTADETTPPDTARIQKAMDSCTQTGTGSVAVKLVSAAAKKDFITGPISIPQGVVLLLDSDVTVYGARNASLYQVAGAAAKCGTVGPTKGGCGPLISAKGANAGIASLRTPTGQAGTIDGRGDTTILGGTVTWYQQARTALDTKAEQSNPRLLVASGNNFTLYNINLRNPAQFTVAYQNGTGFTAWGVWIKTPATARNTDGIDPSGATDVTIRDSFISTGDDCIAIKGARPVSNISIINNHCYGTHGISIGSETNGGASNILVKGNTIDGVDAFGNESPEAWGIRIKSNVTRGGVVQKVAFLDTCIQRATGPMIFDTHYNNGPGYFTGTGDLIPYFHDITVRRLTAVNSQPAAYLTFNGFDATRRLTMDISDVSVDVPADAVTSHAEHATLKVANTNLMVKGTDVTTTDASNGTPSKAPTCTFMPFPG